MARKLRFAIVIEKAENNWGGYLPDLPGCVTTGKTPADVIENMQEAIALYFDGEPESIVPETTTVVDYVDVEITFDVPVPAPTA